MVGTNKYYVNLFEWVNTHGRLSPQNLCGYEYNNVIGIEEAMHNTISNYKGNLTGLISIVTDSNGDFDINYISAGYDGSTATLFIYTNLYAFINGVFTIIEPATATVADGNFIYIDSTGNLASDTNDNIHVVEGIPLYGNVGSGYEPLIERWYIYSNNYTKTHFPNISLLANTISLKNANMNVNAENTDLVSNFNSMKVKVNGNDRIDASDSGVLITGQLTASTDGVNTGNVYNEYDNPNVLYAAAGETDTQVFNVSYDPNVGAYLNTDIAAGEYSGTLIDVVVTDASVLVGKVIVSENGSLVASGVTNTSPVVGLCVEKYTSGVDTRAKILIKGTYKYGGATVFDSKLIYKGDSGEMVLYDSLSAGNKTEVIGIGISGNLIIFDPTHMPLEV